MHMASIDELLVHLPIGKHIGTVGTNWPLGFGVRGFTNAVSISTKMDVFDVICKGVKASYSSL
jgi:hypothetical protein